VGNAVRLFCRLQSVVNWDAVVWMPGQPAAFVAFRIASSRVLFFPPGRKKTSDRWLSLHFQRMIGVEGGKNSIGGYEERLLQP
jgi:hypothetical protein